MTDTSPIQKYDIDAVEKERHLKVSNPFLITCLCILFLAVTGSAHAQGRIRTAAPNSYTQPDLSKLSPGSTCDSKAASKQDGAAPSNLTVTYVGSSQIGIAWTAPTTTPTPSSCVLDHYEITCARVPAANTCGTNPPLKITALSYEVHWIGLPDLVRLFGCRGLYRLK